MSRGRPFEPGNQLGRGRRKGNRNKADPERAAVNIQNRTLFGSQGPSTLSRNALPFPIAPTTIRSMQ